MRAALGVVAACLLCGTAFAELEALDRAAIAEGMSAVKPQVAKCGEKYKVKGVVKVTVHVNPDGTIAEARIKEAPDEKLGTCVLTEVQKATFAKSTKGGSFSYPFVF